MDKAKNKVLKFFPNALSFHNPPFSPSRSNARFSGPIVSLVPREARRTPDTPQEPTSPKVSCLGQIKQRRGKKSKDKLINEEEDEPTTRRRRSRLPSKESKKGKKKEEEGGRMSVEGSATALGQMRRFASSRGSLSNFDWTAQVAPGEEEEDRIAFSAPLGTGAGEVGLMPKEETNLWKRRTMGPPDSVP